MRVQPALPLGRAWTRARLIYVADALNQRVQVLDRDGVFHEQVDGLPLRIGSLSSGIVPFTVTVDSKGLLYESTASCAFPSACSCERASLPVGLRIFDDREVVWERVLHQ